MFHYTGKSWMLKRLAEAYQKAHPDKKVAIIRASDLRNPNPVPPDPPLVVFDEYVDFPWPKEVR